MAETTQRPPVAIIGGGLGGLSAAIHLRVKGYPVAIFEANERLGGRANRIELNGFHFDTGPSLLNYPWVFRNVFEAAGKRMEDYVELLPVEPAVAFQWEDGTRLQLTSEMDQLVEAFAKVEPGSGPGLQRFFADAGAKYDLAFQKLVNRNADSPLDWARAMSFAEMAKLGLWRSLYGELGRFFKSPHIREALGAYGMYLGGSPFDLPGFFSILAYGELAYGLWLPKNGIYGLVEGLERLVRELGVEVHTNAPVDRIETANGRVKGLVMSSGETHAFPIVLSNVDACTTDLHLLRDEPVIEARRKQALRTRQTPGVLTFYWGVKGRIKGIGHHTIFLPDSYRESFDDLFKNKQIPRGLPFYTAAASETDPALAPEGDTTLFVLVPTPVLSQLNGYDWDQGVETIKGQVIERLQAHGADLTPGRIVHEQAYTPVDWQDRFGLHDGSAFGSAHTLFQLGPWRARNYASELPGMYYVGASTTPGTGMPMVMLSGAQAADRIAAHAH